jgi:hypothetical protein
MSNSAHCRIINCPKVEAIGTFLKGTNQFVERHFCLRRRVSGRWLEASSKYTHESPRICEVYIRPSPLTVSQGFAHELLYQANNRAAEVTMYGKLKYTRRLQPSSYCHGEHLDQPKQEGQGHFGNLELMIKLDFLIYDCVKLPVGIRSCTLISRCSDQRGTTS